MDLISKTLHYIGEKYPNATIIQIGAMDGISFDDTRGFLDLYKWKCLLVEPIPSLFEELKNNFKDRDNYTFEQCAVAEHSGEVEMLTIPNEIIEREGLHPGYKGMSVLYPLKNGFGSTYQRDIDVKNQFGTKIRVPALTFKSLLEKHNIQEFDILLCDAEGHDWNIFKQLDLTRYKPKFIRLEYINLTLEEKKLTEEKLISSGYIVDINQDIDAVLKEIWDEIEKPPLTPTLTETPRYTIISGLWDISRTGRNFEEHYLPHLQQLLEIDTPMVFFLPKSLHEIVWKARKPENTFVKAFELEDIRNLYAPHWDKTQEIRTSDKWLNITGEGGWLKSSPQATLEWYNPIVQSKMFMLHDASIWNPFDTDYFFWLDAGITNTVPSTHLVKDNCFDKIISHANPFLFLSYPYESAGEIHGFDSQAMNEIAGTKVEYVCRGGLFGGHKDQIHEANATYYALLQNTLNQGYMGTEESIFTLMAYREPHLYKRYMLDGNGLIVKFTENLINDNIKLEPAPLNSSSTSIKITDKDLTKYKTNLYILTFNFPEQLLHTINSMKKTPEWLEKPNLVLLDNSTEENAKTENQKIALEYNFEYNHLGDNTGICGGRQYAAEHFHKSDADFMFFFEDDMTVNPPEYSGQFCRNGFRKYIPNLYNIVHKVMLKENFDFLKLSYTEVYMDNNIQVSWYNVPQNIRTRDWPDYDKLPITGLDPNAPRTTFKNINVLDELSYIDGHIYYANWPMIVSKTGNKKMFIDTKWAHPYEQTWMSYMYQETLKGNLNPAILLASPIWHDRIKHYRPEERREN